MSSGAISRRVVLLAVALVAVAVPSGAAAATVVNGDFESGKLNGWHTQWTTGAGNWFAYKGTKAPIGFNRGATVQPPPQGTYAAIADEANPENPILYQDVELEPGVGHRLSLLVYYTSDKPIAIPTPDTLSVDDEVLQGRLNQQFRIDVIKPGAPLETLDPADILRTVFRLQPGAPRKLQPTRMTADLSAFAGQTVRLRIAVAAHEEVLNAGVDAISIDRPGDAVGGGADRLGFGKTRANRKNGTVAVPVHVPGAGLLTARGATGKFRGLVKPESAKAGKAGTVTLRLRPTRAGAAILAAEHKLRVRVSFAFRAAGAAPETATRTVVFRLVRKSTA